MKGKAMSVEKQKLEDIRRQVRDSKELTDPHKDSLDDMLRLTADATNGVPEANRIRAIAVGMAAIGAVLARDAMYRNEDIRKMIETAMANHVVECPVAKELGGGALQGRDGRDVRDSLVITGKAGKVSGPAGAVKLISILAFVGWLVYVAAKGAEWI
jgi:hypothetical protein